MAGWCPAGHDLGPGEGRRGCRRCRRDRVVDMAMAAEASLPRPVIEAAVDAAAPAGHVLWHLEQALAGDPGTLILGAPPVAGALAAELIARGSVTLAVPACAACGRTGKPLFRGEGGGACQRCRAWQTAEPCSACGKTRPVAVRAAAGQPLCETCRRRSGRAHRECGTCGRTAPIAVRGRDGQPDICVNCYRMPEATCGTCGRRRECSFAATASPVCLSCSPKATAICARCGQDRPAQARWPEGPVCDPCYTTALRLRGQCASCGQVRRLVAPPGPGAVTCSDCAGLPVTHACADCGAEDKLYERGRCERCSLRRRATTLLAQPDGQVPAVLLPVLEAICAARIPKSALNWLRRSHGAALLAGMASGTLPATHEALDTDPRRRAADFLRHMLTSGGVLPARDEELARTGQWLNDVIESVQPAAARRVARAYATWQVMRRLRASAGRAARPRTYTAHARRNVRAAASFLAWLHSSGCPLTDCQQAHIDSWLATGPAACQAGDFLSWAASHGHCQAFSLPGPVRASGTAVSQDQRWALAARLLRDDTLDPTDRAAGCLLLLYGQQLSRIAAMTTSQITTRGDTVLVRFGHHDVPVPEPLGTILTQLTRAGRTHTGTGSPLTTSWLFPGGLPGRPITASRLSQRLNILGIYAMAGRRATLTDLAAQMPAAVLADLLRLSPGTAVRWMRQAGGDWTGYAADLARTPHHRP
jgi:integrase